MEPKQANDILGRTRKILPPEGFFEDWNFDFMVEARQVYGKELYYPANDRAELFLRLTGKKTFDKYELKIIQKVGYNVIFTTKTMEDL
jgi:hypothetical protein